MLLLGSKIQELFARKFFSGKKTFFFCWEKLLHLSSLQSLFLNWRILFSLSFLPVFISLSLFTLQNCNHISHLTYAELQLTNAKYLNESKFSLNKLKKKKNFMCVVYVRCCVVNLNELIIVARRKAAGGNSSQVRYAALFSGPFIYKYVWF